MELFRKSAKAGFRVSEKANGVVTAIRKIRSATRPVSVWLRALMDHFALREFETSPACRAHAAAMDVTGMVLRGLATFDLPRIDVGAAAL